MDMKCTLRVTGITDMRDAGSMTRDRVDSCMAALFTILYRNTHARTKLLS